MPLLALGIALELARCISESCIGFHTFDAQSGGPLSLVRPGAPVELLQAPCHRGYRRVLSRNLQGSGSMKQSYGSVKVQHSLPGHALLAQNRAATRMHCRHTLSKLRNAAGIDSCKA